MPEYSLGAGPVRHPYARVDNIPSVRTMNLATGSFLICVTQETKVDEKKVEAMSSLGVSYFI